ncbi:MAG: hypothetical protein CMO55_23170 [Verrucomicrobiales bacterium]|nr:hypothetical protein [Verrucomicrobiales bacterium]
MPQKNPRKGRPLTGKTPRKRFNITLDPTLQRKAAKASKKEGESFSMWVEIALQEKLDRKKR